MNPCPYCRGNGTRVRLHSMHAVMPRQWKNRSGIGFIQERCPVCRGDGTETPDYLADPRWLEPMEPHPTMVGCDTADAVSGEIAA